MANVNRDRTDLRRPHTPSTDRRPPLMLSGHHVATFDRPGYRRDDEDQQLRISVEVTETGRTYVSMRVWQKWRTTGEWRPTHSGVTVRQKEGENVLAALIHALDLARDPAIAAEIRTHNERIRSGADRPGLN